MSREETIKILQLVLLGGVVYIASGLWSAFFIPSVEMDPDWCHDPPGMYEYKMEYGIGCVDFKNDVESAKYYHNAALRDRNRYWLYFTMGAGGVAGIWLFYLIPAHREDLKGTASSHVVGGFFAGLTAALVVPALMNFILPAPAEWFPAFIVEIAAQRSEDALHEILLRSR